MKIYEGLKRDDVNIVKEAVNKDALFVAACSLGKEKIVKALLPKIKDVTMGLQEALLFNRNNIVEILKNANYDKEKIGRLAFLSKKLNDKINSLGINIEATIETSEIKDLKNHYFNFLAHQPKNLTELFKQAVGDKNKFALRLARIIHAAIGEEEFKGEILKDNYNEKEEEFDFEEVIKVLDEVDDYLTDANKMADKIIKVMKWAIDEIESGEETEGVEDELELALTPAYLRKNISKSAALYEQFDEETRKVLDALKYIKDDMEGNPEELKRRLNELNEKFALGLPYISNRDMVTKVRSMLIEKIWPKLEQLDKKIVDFGDLILQFSMTIRGKKTKPALVKHIISEIDRLITSSPDWEELKTKGEQTVQNMIKLIEGIKRVLDKSFPESEGEIVYTMQKTTPPRPKSTKPETLREEEIGGEESLF
jgi:uncharacterized protein YqeY